MIKNRDFSEVILSEALPGTLNNFVDIYPWHLKLLEIQRPCLRNFNCTTTSGRNRATLEEKVLQGRKRCLVPRDVPEKFLLTSRQLGLRSQRDRCQRAIDKGLPIRHPRPLHVLALFSVPNLNEITMYSYKRTHLLLVRVTIATA